MGCWQPCINLYRRCGEDQTEICAEFLVVFPDHGLGHSCLWLVQFLSCLPGSQDAEFCLDGVRLPPSFFGSIWGCCVEGYPPPCCLCVLVLLHRIWELIPLGIPLCTSELIHREEDCLVAAESIPSSSALLYITNPWLPSQDSSLCLLQGTYFRCHQHHYNDEFCSLAFYNVPALLFSLGSQRCI